MRQPIVEISGVRVPRFLYGTAWKESETQRLVELADGVGEDGRGDHRLRVVLVGGHALELQELAQLLGLLGALRGLDRLLLPALDVLAELRVLALRVEDVGRPVVGVFERARDAVGGDLEGAELRWSLRSNGNRGRDGTSLTSSSL